jgi:hypothetical protein
VNRPPPGPGSGREPGPDTPWYRRRPDSGDPTSIARPRPPQRAYPAPAPPPPAHRPPPPGLASQAPDVPWYLQRPDRAIPPPPAVERSTPLAEPKSGDSAGRNRLAPWLLVGAGALAVLIGAAVLLADIFKMGITGGTVLDVTKVQSGVLQTLSDPASGYGANTVTDVSCNGGRNPSAAKGTTFVCDAIVNATQRHVSVFVSDDCGTYEIDYPR